MTTKYGFIENTDECQFAYGLNMSSLTITPPEGQKIGLNMGRAMAAAPELLAALEQIARLASEGEVSANMQYALADISRAAIAKAKGE